MGNEFHIFTSLRYDIHLREARSKDPPGSGWNFENESPLYLLDFHRDRLLRAASYWKWEQAVGALSGEEGLQGLSRLVQETVESPESSPLRLRILVSREGDIKCEKFGTPDLPRENLFPMRLPPPNSPQLDGDPSRESPFILMVDNVTTSRSEYTHYKTTKREMYDKARQRANISPKDSKEVLVVNHIDGSVMEGTITTPYFWREGQWVTPPVAVEFSRSDGSGGQDGTSRRWALEKGFAKEQLVTADSLIDGEECWLSNGLRGFIWAKVSL